MNFLLPGSPCGSAPAFYTDRQRLKFFTARIFLRQRPRSLYCPDLLAAAPPLFILPFSCCGSALPFILTISRCGSAPAIYTYHFSLRKRPRFLHCPILVASEPLLFILTDSRCGSAPAFYTDQFSLRQRPRFLYCPFLVAAAPPLFILTGSAMNFLLPRSPCGSAPAFYTDRQRHKLFTARISLRQRPRSFYCPDLLAAAPPFLDRKSVV